MTLIIPIYPNLVGFVCFCHLCIEVSANTVETKNLTNLKITKISSNKKKQWQHQEYF